MATKDTHRGSTWITVTLNFVQYNVMQGMVKLLLL